MTRTSTVCVLSTVLAVLALSANNANAGPLSLNFKSPHVQMSTVHVPTTGGGSGKINAQAIQTNNGNGGTGTGTGNPTANK